MNFNSKITSLQQQARVLQTQAYLLQVLETCPNIDDLHNFPMLLDALQPSNNEVVKPEPQSQAFPNAQAMMPVCHNAQVMMPVCPPAFNNQLNVITTTKVITRVHPKLTDVGLDIIMEKILKEQPPSLSLRDKVVQYIDINMESFLVSNLGYKQEFFCVCDPDGKYPLTNYVYAHKIGKCHQGMIDKLVSYIKQESLRKYGVCIC